MREAFLWGVPAGIDAQPTGENFSSKILWAAPYQGWSVSASPSIENHKNLRADHCRQGGRMGPILGYAFPGPKILQVWGGAGKGRGERLLHGGHQGRPGAAATVWTGAGEGEAGAWTERWRLPWSGRPETAQNER
jgi:hypothetical protein